ncbi:MAG: hypothetical protein KDF49_03890, partial [Nitrosomonas sp.]|nr:hypothetical protein [Nitrosomonas sp.]
RFETLRIFYTRRNRIIHHTAISSRLPSSVYLDKINGTEHHLGNWVNNTRFKVQADGYWLLHNHPSGAPRSAYVKRNNCCPVKWSLPVAREACNVL